MNPMSLTLILRHKLGLRGLAGGAHMMLASSLLAAAGAGPEPVFVKPAPVPQAEMAAPPPAGVTACEVNDYRPGHYADSLPAGAPHADLNPGKAVIVRWAGRGERFVFSHEASYCPYLELPSGAAMSNQFFEGNLGEAELMNSLGRRERNSFVDVMASGPGLVWVRWTYFAVNMKDDREPRLRGTEDYLALPNGLVLRRATYESLLPDKVVGYSTQPVELFGVAPLGAGLADLFARDPEQGDYLTHVALDLYSDRRYGIHWTEEGKVRRTGDDATLAAISASRGYALVLPFKERLLFAILGEASGFPAAHSQLIDHSTPGAEGGSGWGVGRWDHWPIGWLNSQGSNWKPGSKYPFSFGSIGHFLVPEGKCIRTFWADYSLCCQDMAMNRWTARRVYYVLIGSAGDLDEVRRIGRAWLDLGADCARVEKVAALRGPAR